MKSNEINLDVKYYPRLIKTTQIIDLKNLNQNITLQKLNGNCKNTQSERTAKMLDPELSGAHLNSVSSAFNSEQEGRVTVVVAKAKYHTATENQAKQRFKHSARSPPSNAVINVLSDS